MGEPQFYQMVSSMLLEQSLHGITSESYYINSTDPITKKKPGIKIIDNITIFPQFLKAIPTNFNISNKVIEKANTVPEMLKSETTEVQKYLGEKIELELIDAEIRCLQILEAEITKLVLTEDKIAGNETNIRNTIEEHDKRQQEQTLTIKQAVKSCFTEKDIEKQTLDIEQSLELLTCKKQLEKIPIPPMSCVSVTEGQTTNLQHTNIITRQRQPEAENTIANNDTEKVAVIKTDLKCREKPILNTKTTDEQAVEKQPLVFQTYTAKVGNEYKLEEVREERDKNVKVSEINTTGKLGKPSKQLKKKRMEKVQISKRDKKKIKRVLSGKLSSNYKNVTDHQDVRIAIREAAERQAVVYLTAVKVENKEQPIEDKVSEKMDSVHNECSFVKSTNDAAVKHDTQTNTLELQYTFVSSRKGRQLLMWKKYTYNQNHNTARYYCTQRFNGCKATVKLHKDGYIQDAGYEHTHDPPHYVVTDSGQYVKI